MSDDTVHLAFAIDGLTSPLHVTTVEGREGLSELYTFEIGVASEDATLVLEELVGARARLTLRGGGSTRLVHGIVGRVEQTDDVDQLARYSVSLVSELKRLELQQDCRVYAETTVPEILTSVLREAGITNVRSALRTEFPQIEIAIQYRESNWAFLSRLMESEGIFYYFVHEDDAAILVLGDGPHAHTLLEPEVTRVTRFRRTEELKADRVAVRSHSFKNPSLRLEGGAQAEGGSRIEVLDHVDLDRATLADPQLADRRARQRLEQLQVDRAAARATTTSPNVTPGHFMTVQDHPREAFNQQYLLTSVSHRAAQPAPGMTASKATYSNEIACIPSSVPFRPTLTTPRPRSEGAQTAVVVGPKGEEIYTDELGRIRVQFSWDRRGTNDEHSSCWIRVAQLWAGSGFGAMHIPRVGQEVLVDFLGGDIDRPIVVGGLYHATNVPPYALPANKTVTGFKTSSTSGGQGSNELRFDDAHGGEEVYLHAQRDLDVVVENDRTTNVGLNDELTVKGERAKFVAAAEVETIGLTKSTSIGGAHTHVVGASQSIEVREHAALRVGGDRTEEVTGTITQVAGQSLVLTVGGNKNERVAHASTETVGGDKNTTIERNSLTYTGADQGVTVGGSATETVELDKIVTVGGRLQFVCGKSRITVEQTGAILIEGSDIEIRSHNPVKVEGRDLQIKSTGAVNVRAGGDVKVRGGRVNFN